MKKTKVCTKCNKRKKLSEFYNSTTDYCKDGHTWYCKDCINKDTGDYQNKHKNQHNETSKMYRKRNKEKIKEYDKKYRETHKEELKERRRKYHLKNKIERNKAIRNWTLIRDFGITEKDYQTFFKNQNGVCAICGTKESDLGNNGKIKKLAVDHDHKTGKVRGLLCGRCNLMLGRLKDSINLLNCAIKYLQRNV